MSNLPERPSETLNKFEVGLVRLLCGSAGSTDAFFKASNLLDKIRVGADLVAALSLVYGLRYKKNRLTAAGTMSLAVSFISDNLSEKFRKFALTQN